MIEHWRSIFGKGSAVGTLNCQDLLVAGLDDIAELAGERAAARMVLLHPMLAVDAENGNCLGLLSGQVWTRKGRRTVSHDLRDLSDKESQRWVATALAAKPLLAKAAMVTVLGDRESDIFALYAGAAEQHFHVLTRSMHDRKLADGTGLYAASEAMTFVDQRAIVLPARAQRAERVAVLKLRFGAVNLARPQSKFLRHLPESLPLTLVEVSEPDSPAGTEPLRWRLLTTHPVANAEEAWRIVEWYKRRWLIEQFFRVLKTQGFKLEDSQIATADRLLKLVAIAAKAAVITLQLLQARDGRGYQPVRLVFDANEVATLAALNRNLEAVLAHAGHLEFEPVLDFGAGKAPLAADLPAGQVALDGQLAQLAGVAAEQVGQLVQV